MVKGSINSSNPLTDELINLKVTVIDTNNNPIENATVTLTDTTNEFTGKTGSAGGCTINLPAGTYNTECEAAGYVSDIDSITVDENNKTLTITLMEE